VCEFCGAESIPARLPSGRHIELGNDDVWVADDEPWPDGRLFNVIPKPVDGRPEPFYAQPVIAFADRRMDGKPAGPFRREHVCERVSA
jgi:hypothetical protein